MKFRFTIGRKIGTGFGVLILLTVIVFILTNDTLNKSSALDARVNQVYEPTLAALDKLDGYINDSREGVVYWATVQSAKEDQKKVELVTLTTATLPTLHLQLDSISKFWTDTFDLAMLDTIFVNFDSLMVDHDFVRNSLPEFESYGDANLWFEVIPMVENDGRLVVKTNLLLQNLDKLVRHREETLKTARRELEEAGELLQFILRYLGLVLVVGGIFVAILTVRSITKPVQNLRVILTGLGKGRFPEKDIKPSNDEIGDMSAAMNTLVDGLKRTTDFSREVGSGNFEYEHQPLSEEDVLGHALLKMRDDLAVNERMLELKVQQRTEEVVRKAAEIEQQKEKIEELYKDVTDSIRYAKRLQESILPSDSLIKTLLPNSFVLYRPKDIVSGDFYWFEQANNKVLFAAVDCTGHGVPGAFMSLVGHNGLKQAVNEHKLHNPSKILLDLDQMATETLNQGDGDGESNVRDGMDLALCALDKDNMKLEYAGAYNPLYLIRNGELLQTKGDKHAIGGRTYRTAKVYTNHEIDLLPGDTIYIFSDGYADQFGGSRGKKFMYKQFRDLLLGICHKTLDEQKETLNNTIEEWKGTFDQVDDILVIGVRV
jgi:serine phosphatase RsbU (regulator of sigma subunit)/HAMP domain-containing protein